MIESACRMSIDKRLPITKGKVPEIAIRRLVFRISLPFACFSEVIVQIQTLVHSTHCYVYCFPRFVFLFLLVL